MAGIGEGYVWPNLTIVSNGVRTILISKPSVRPDAKPFRLFSARPYILPAAQFEAAVDEFVPRILGRLRGREVADTNLDRLWHDVLGERADPTLARRRRLEALLGRDADEIEDGAVERLISDEPDLGEKAVEELAAGFTGGQTGPDAAMIREIAREQGFDAVATHGVSLDPGFSSPMNLGEEPARRIGARAALAIRAQEQLGDEPIRNDKLSELAGVDARALAKGSTAQGFSFVLDQNESSSRVVLRSKWETGRRFELARLLADRLLGPRSDKLRPATRVYTFRQKMQRSFAAELLSPFQAIDAMLDGDYSSEAQQDVASHFDVSERTVLTLLVNHERLEREELGELDTAGGMATRGAEAA